MEEAATIFYTLEEILKHDGKQDPRTWIIIRDVVYDVTDYLNDWYLLFWWYSGQCIALLQLYMLEAVERKPCRTAIILNQRQKPMSNGTKGGRGPRYWRTCFSVWCWPFGDSVCWIRGRKTQSHWLRIIGLSLLTCQNHVNIYGSETVTRGSASYFDFPIAHPGGPELIQEWAGKDGTREFDNFGHSGDAKRELKKYKIGEVVEEERKKKKKKSDKEKEATQNADSKKSKINRSCISIVTCGLCG